jgi:hypothetical protein
MRFEELSRSFLDGSARDRGNASLEYKVLSGPFLGVGHNAQETVLTLRGNGRLEFFRRGDFAERGDRPPGLWRGRCSTAEVEEAWRLLGGLNRDSFPPKPDDPGDAVTMLNAYFPNAFVSLTWGAMENAMDSPAERFIACMEALTVKAMSERPEWAVELDCRAVSSDRGRLELDAVFRNPGRSAVGLFIPGRENSGGFTLRCADVLEVTEATQSASIPAEAWSKAHAVPADEGEDRLCSLAAGGELSLRLEAEIAPREGVSRLGKLQYEQLGHLDFLAGNRILSGECFSAPFQIPAS